MFFRFLGSHFTRESSESFKNILTGVCLSDLKVHEACVPKWSQHEGSVNMVGVKPVFQSHISRQRLCVS